MSEFKGIKQLQALMRAYKAPKSKDYIGQDAGSRAARGVLSVGESQLRKRQKEAQVIKETGQKLFGVQTTSRSGQKKEVLGFYNVPNPNSPVNRLMRYMGKKTGNNK